MRIEEIINELHSITTENYSIKNRMGIFSAVYCRTTNAIHQAIVENRFEDPKRMELLDVHFALRYIDAYKNYQKGNLITQSWFTAFEASKNDNYLLLQHLLVGMNAHIMLDLAVSSAEISPNDSIHSLKNDFMTVNDVLFELINDFQDIVNMNAPLLKVFDVVGLKLDEFLIAKGIENARKKAWEYAVELAYLEGNAFQQTVQSIDSEVAKISTKILKTPTVLSPLHWVISKTQKSQIFAIPRLLQGR
jgi:hypothetical protein